MGFNSGFKGLKHFVECVRVIYRSATCHVAVRHRCLEEEGDSFMAQLLNVHKFAVMNGFQYVCRF